MTFFVHLRERMNGPARKKAGEGEGETAQLTTNGPGRPRLGPFLLVGGDALHSQHQKSRKYTTNVISKSSSTSMSPAGKEDQQRTYRTPSGQHAARLQRKGHMDGVVLDMSDSHQLDRQLTQARVKMWAAYTSLAAVRYCSPLFLPLSLLAGPASITHPLPCGWSPFVPLVAPPPPSPLPLWVSPRPSYPARLRPFKIFSNQSWM